MPTATLEWGEQAEGHRAHLQLRPASRHTPLWPHVPPHTEAETSAPGFGETISVPQRPPSLVPVLVRPDGVKQAGPDVDTQCTTGPREDTQCPREGARRPGWMGPPSSSLPEPGSSLLTPLLSQLTLRANQVGRVHVKDSFTLV